MKNLMEKKIKGKSIDFNIKMKVFLKAYDGIDSDIWEIFYKFIELKEVAFSNPVYWKIEEDNEHICFNGTDDTEEHQSKSLFIPLKWFSDYDLTLKEETKNEEKS